MEVEANIYLINIDGHIYIVINNLIIKQMEERELLSLNLPLRSYTKLLLNYSDYFSNLLYNMTKTTTFWKRSDGKQAASYTVGGYIIVSSSLTSFITN